MSTLPTASTSPRLFPSLECAQQCQIRSILTRIHRSPLPSLKLTKCSKIIDDSILALRFSIQLLSLDISGIFLTSACLPGLNGLRNLRHLSLGSASSDVILAQVTLTCLTSFDVSDDANITDLALVPFLSANTGLTQLLMRKCTNSKLTNRTLALAAALPVLERLDADGCRQVDDQTFSAISSTVLRHINLDNCAVSEKTLAHLASACPNLEYVR